MLPCFLFEIFLTLAQLHRRDVDDPHTAAQSAWIPQPRPPETSDDSSLLAKTINIQGVIPLPGEFASRTIIQ